MLQAFMMDKLRPLTRGGVLVRLRDVKVRLETWRILIKEFL